MIDQAGDHRRLTALTNRNCLGPPMPMIYHFGDFRLNLATRELWHGEELAGLPRRAFDGLAYLVEHRDRAVSRDELTEALWGHPVEDIQVTQLVMRLRRQLGDDSQQPRFIRAVPGYGYRWIADTAAVSGALSDADAEQAAGQSTKYDDRSPAPTATLATPKLRRSVWAVVGLVLVLVAAILVTDFLTSPRSEAEPLAREPGDAIVVMPLQIDQHGESDIGWARLGAMDLIAERLRDAGLPVPPSESVISAVQAVDAGPESEFQSGIREALGADILVQGRVRKSHEDWVVELVATTASGRERRIESSPAGLIRAAESAANLLLAALGRPASVAARENEVLSERLQRARAASLALELDTARAILAEAPEGLLDEPELRHELAWIEMRSGRPHAVREITRSLLEEPAVLERPRLHAQVLILHGVAHVQAAGGWLAGEEYFDAAVSVLDGEPWAPELGRALAMRSAARTVDRDFDGAARDLGRARTLFDAGGNRAGMAQVENYSGNLELARGRPNDALAHFRAALEIDTGFSSVDGMRANLSAMQRAQMQLLRWPDALNTSERLWHLREQFEQPVDPHRRHSLNMHRVEVLVALGRHREARAILSELTHMRPEIPAHGLRYELEMRARLAWQESDWQEALDLSRQALELWLSEAVPPTGQPIELALLNQRASMRAGSPMAVHAQLTDVPELEQEPAYLVARGEWAAHIGNHDVADDHFFRAAAQAEERAVPALFVLVADAYARWLVERERFSDAVAVAGRVARWAKEDYDSALLQVVVLHASGRAEAWRLALGRAQRLAGEREIPDRLTRSPR